mgnify:CR=1 FL=1
MSPLTCPYSRRCGGCQLLSMSYEEELAHKQELARRHLSRFGKVLPILGAANPCYYRNKVEAAFGLDRSRKVIAGTYEPRSHRIVDINSCLNEDKTATAIIVTIKKLLPSFRLTPYDEDARTGFLRHVLVRRGIHTGEVMVVLVTASPVFPSRQNFLKALLAAHPEITTIVQNVNNRRTSVLLGDREQTLYGPGFIRDTLCGMNFRISPRSFYQINPAQTEVLYRRAIKAAGLTGKERVLDAYCGIGTIGMIAAAEAREVIGVEQNPAAVRDAIRNARENGVENIRFVAADATEWMQAAAAEKLSIDILLMDPPRSGSTPEFLSAAVKMAPRRIVYISCCPETQAHDLALLQKGGYRVTLLQPVDMFPHTEHIETVVLLSKGEIDSKKVRVEVSLENMDMSGFQKGATYPQIKEYVQEHSGLKVSSLYISQVKRKCGLDVGQNYNLSKKEDAKQPQCPPEKEKAIMEALQHFGMI